VPAIMALGALGAVVLLVVWLLVAIRTIGLVRVSGTR